MVVLKQMLIGVVAASMQDFNQWAANRSKDDNIRYHAITTIEQAKVNCDELIITPTASSNGNFYNIYRTLNGKYSKARQDKSL